MKSRTCFCRDVPTPASWRSPVSASWRSPCQALVAPSAGRDSHGRTVPYPTSAPDAHAPRPCGDSTRRGPANHAQNAPAKPLPSKHARKAERRLSHRDERQHGRRQAAHYKDSVRIVYHYKVFVMSDISGRNPYRPGVAGR